MSYVQNFVCNFVCNLFVFVKSCHGVFARYYVFLGDVGIDFSHGGVVGPAADLHGDFFRHIQVVGQGREAMTQTVGADFRETGGNADSIDPVPDG